MENPLAKKTEFTGQLARYKNMSLMLKEFVKENNLSVVIHNQQYVNIEGWQFLGSLMGLTAIILEVKDISKDNYLSFRAEAELYNRDMQKIGYCTSTCSNYERKKRNFEPHALESMAQTRAISKLYRLRLGFVAKMSGFEATPAEEILEEEEGIIYQQNTRDRIKMTKGDIEKWLLDNQQPTWITDKARIDIANIDWSLVTVGEARKWYNLVVENFNQATPEQVNTIKKIVSVSLFSDVERELVYQDIDKIGSSTASSWVNYLKKELVERTGMNEGEQAKPKTEEKTEHLK